MPAYNFPTLTRQPSYPLEEESEDFTIRSVAEDGVMITRPKYTRVRSIFTLNYELLPTADKTTLMGFANTSVSQGAVTFTWKNPVSNVTFTVRFQELPKPSYVQNGYWSLSFKLREV